MLHGLSFACSLGCNDLDAESYSLEVIQLCSGAEWIWSDATTIYADIVTTTGSVGKVEFSHCG
jgi:hypothetical protein